MNKSNSHLEQISEIRSLMERSSRFLSLSGLSGVFAGIFALIGAAAAYFYMQAYLAGSYHEIAARIPVVLKISFLNFCLLDAMTVAILSLISGIFFTYRKAKKQGLKVWDKLALRLVVSLFIPLITGGLFCLLLLKYNLFGLIAPTTLIFYGLGLLNASKYTLDEIRYLGITEIILGLLGVYLLGYGLVIWALGFGVLHIIYGTLMYWKYERKSSSAEIEIN